MSEIQKLCGAQHLGLHVSTLHELQTCRHRIVAEISRLNKILEETAWVEHWMKVCEEIRQLEIAIENDTADTLKSVAENLPPAQRMPNAGIWQDHAAKVVKVDDQDCVTWRG